MRSKYLNQINQAIKDNNVKEINDMLAEGDNLDSNNSWEESPLVALIDSDIQDKALIFKALLNKGASVDIRKGDSNFNLLHYIAIHIPNSLDYHNSGEQQYKNNIEGMIKLLVNKRPQLLEEQDFNKNTPLALAMAWGDNNKIAALLLSLGANPNCSINAEQKSQSLINYCVETNAFDTALEIVKSKAFNSKNLNDLNCLKLWLYATHNQIPLLFYRIGLNNIAKSLVKDAIIQNNPNLLKMEGTNCEDLFKLIDSRYLKEICEIFKQSNNHTVKIIEAFINIYENKTLPTMLIMRKDQPNDNTVKNFIEKNTWINYYSSYNELRYILNYEAYRKDIRMMAISILRGADPNIRIENDIPLICSLAVAGYYDGVKLLLKYGVDVNSMDFEDQSVLINATQSEHIEIVKLLLEHGANVNLKDKDGETALMRAVEEEQTEIVKLLLKHGANVNLKDSEGNTAFVLAVEEGQTEIVKLLLEHGAKINLRDGEGNTALILAAYNGHTEIVKLLLEHGAEINLKNSNGDTPLTLAVEEGKTEIVKLLLKHGADPYITNNEKKTAFDLAKDDNIKFMIEDYMQLYRRIEDSFKSTLTHELKQRANNEPTQSSIKLTAESDQLLQQKANEGRQTYKFWKSWSAYVNESMPVISQDPHFKESFVKRLNSERKDYCARLISD